MHGNALLAQTNKFIDFPLRLSMTPLDNNIKKKLADTATSITSEKKAYRMVVDQISSAWDTLKELVENTDLLKVMTQKGVDRIPLLTVTCGDRPFKSAEIYLLRNGSDMYACIDKDKYPFHATVLTDKIYIIPLPIYSASSGTIIWDEKPESFKDFMNLVIKHALEKTLGIYS